MHSVSFAKYNVAFTRSTIATSWRPPRG
jgi:hypothetical protein